MRSFFFGVAYAATVATGFALARGQWGMAALCALLTVTALAAAEDER